MKVIILGGKNYSNKRIAAELKKLGHKVALIDPLKFTLKISDRSGHDRLYYNNKRMFASSISGIVPRIGRNFRFGCAVVKHLSENMSIYTPSPSHGMKNASDKYQCVQILSKARLQVPKTLYFQNPSNYSFLIEQLGGYPVVAKLLTGSQGAGVFILNDDVAGSTALSTIAKSHKVLLQEYIETAKKDENKCDVRAWVVGNKVVASMKRFAVDKDFRSNYSISKSAEKYNLSEDQKQFAVDCAKAVGLEFCGVDLMIDVETEKTYCIECNSNASLSGIEKVTKINVAKKIAEFMDSKIQKEVDAKSFAYSYDNAPELSYDKEDTENIYKTFLAPDDDTKSASEFNIKPEIKNAKGWSDFAKSQVKKASEKKEIPLYMRDGITAKAIAMYGKN